MPGALRNGGGPGVGTAVLPPGVGELLQVLPASRGILSQRAHLPTQMGLWGMASEKETSKAIETFCWQRSESRLATAV
jgi:hypothetical protein